MDSQKFEVKFGDEYISGYNLRSKRRKYRDYEDEKPDLIVYERRKKIAILEKTVSTKEKRISKFFKSKCGRQTIGPKAFAKGVRRTPSQVYVKEYEWEWDEKRDFYLDTCRNVERKFDVRKVSTNITSLMGERATIFPVGGLTTITSSTSIVDVDGNPLLYYCKGALRWPFPKDRQPALVGKRALAKLVKGYPPPKPEKTNVRHKGVVHRKTHGMYHFALWHATGWGKHVEKNVTPTKGAILSKNVVKIAAKKINVVARFYLEFTPITQAIRALFQVLDPLNYERFCSNYKELANKSVLKWLSTTGGNCFMGKAVLSGLCCQPHQDSSDASHGWAADLAFGDFQGGNLEVPQLGCQFELQPGDIMFIRSALLQHSVSKVTRGHRYGVVYFTHESMMASS